MRHLFDKLGVHRRLEAVERARALGLLVPRTISGKSLAIGSPPTARSPAGHGKSAVVQCGPPVS